MNYGEEKVNRVGKKILDLHDKNNKLMNRIFCKFFIILVITASPLWLMAQNNLIPGASRIELYKDMIEGKSVAVVANQTSMIGQTHLVDKLISIGIDLKVIFAPEHGFRNMADAGERIEDSKDPETGISLISLYGTHLKPTADDLKGIDVVIFDIQDVGARFYTYISTLHYILESCGENQVKCIVLDRPNPNGFYFDGNILDKAQSKFTIGM